MATPIWKQNPVVKQRRKVRIRSVKSAGGARNKLRERGIKRGARKSAHKRGLY